MKTLQSIATRLLALSLIFTVASCSLFDPCSGVVCENGGTCNDGDCECTDAFTGESCATYIPVQARLDNGQTPLKLFQSGVKLDSLYGKNYAGGIIFFVNTEPDKYPMFTGEGLVCTDTDYGHFDEWGCFEVTGATDSVVGTGAINTRKMIEKNCSRPPKSALICDNLVLNGFDDWFLPSIHEVDLIYHNLHLKGHNDFTQGEVQRYQSSTEADANRFMLRLFWKDQIAPISKISGDDIRPARAF